MRRFRLRRAARAAVGGLFAALFATAALAAGDPPADAAKAVIDQAASDRAPGVSKQLPMSFPSLSKESATCASCHAKESAGVYQQWGQSKHYGGNVGCYECHKANPGDPGAISHKDFTINVLVSPKVCSQCHPREVKEMDKSYHATAGQILGSLDNTLAEVVEGSIHAPIALNGESPVAVQGCWQCHGSPVKVLPNGKLDPATWPNSGIGRLNPDGTKGTCNACHQRHTFSVAQARQPETCGKCHLGPDHPQKEVYDESKHGIAYRSNVDKMNLSSPKWIVGQDYSAAPTCATCHMSATNELPVTHDVGARITWNLRAPISPRVDAKALAEGKQVKPWQDRQKDMKQVCTSCHGTDWVENWYKQYDSTVVAYNEKFAKPGAAIMKALADNGLVTKVDFDAKIKWTWYYLWHHQGRRARHGAAMQGPDYVQWHGFFEVAQAFYTELIPEARELIEKARKDGKVEQANAVEKVIDEILARPEHQWINGKNPPLKAEHDKARIEFMKQFNDANAGK